MQANLQPFNICKDLHNGSSYSSSTSCKNENFEICHTKFSIPLNSKEVMGREFVLLNIHGQCEVGHKSISRLIRNWWVNPLLIFTPNTTEDLLIERSNKNKVAEVKGNFENILRIFFSLPTEILGKLYFKNYATWHSFH